MTAENIYRILINFRQIYDIMDRKERKELMEALISEIQIHKEAKPNGQWLKSIRFRLPIIPENLMIDLDNGHKVEAICLFEKAGSPAGAFVPAGGK